MNESAKPIEKGCMAIVVNAYVDKSRIGKIVVVEEEYFESRDRQGNIYSNPWLVALEGYTYAAEKRHLLRIDDPDLQKQIESEKERENV